MGRHLAAEINLGSKNKKLNRRNLNGKRAKELMCRFVKAVNKSFPNLLDISRSIFQIADSTMWLNIH